MTGEDKEFIRVKECVVNKFGFSGVDPQGQTSGADQAALIAYSDGTKGLATTGAMNALVDLVVEIRATLVANGTMKGAA